MKDLGYLHYFLGVQDVRLSHGLHLSQKNYIIDFLLKFYKHTCNPIRAPVPSPTSVSLMDGELLSDTSEYRSIVGDLQYMTITHPDIVYALNVVSHFMQCPSYYSFAFCEAYLHVLIG